MSAPIPESQVKTAAQILEIQVPTAIKWEEQASNLGLRSVEVAIAALQKPVSASTYVQVKNGSQVIVYSREEILRFATDILGLKKEKFPNENERIQACCALIMKRAEGSFKIIDEYRAQKNEVDKAQTQSVASDINRIQKERELLSINQLKRDANFTPELVLKSEPLHKTLIESALEFRKPKYEFNLDERVLRSRLSVLEDYMKKLIDYCKVLDPKFKPYDGTNTRERAKETHSPMIDQLEALKSIEVYLFQEKKRLEEIVGKVKKYVETKSKFAENSDLNVSLLVVEKEISGLMQAVQKEQEAKRGNPGEVLFKAMQTNKVFKAQVEALRKLGLVSAEELRVLDRKLKVLKTQINEMTEKLQMGSKLEKSREALGKGEVRSKKWIVGKPRNPKIVEQEIRSIVSTLLAKALIIQDEQAWKEVNGIITHLKKYENGKFFNVALPENSPLKKAWEDKVSGIAKKSTTGTE